MCRPYASVASLFVCPTSELGRERGICDTHVRGLTALEIGGVLVRPIGAGDHKVGHDEHRTLETYEDIQYSAI